METLSELLKILKTLPLGNVYKKTINGKTYYYHQYFYNGQRISNIVKKEELKDLKEKISKRIEIKRKIKSIKLKKVTLSTKANELTGYVMSGNNVVAKYEKGNLVDLNKDLCPLIIKRTGSLEKFLKLRIMDMSRTNARILKKILNINVEEDYKISLYSYALSISDNYWFKPKGSKLKYKDVGFDNDSLFETALKGEVNVFYNKAHLSPELTTVGSFEKGWRYLNKKWWLYKSGNDKQLFSELFCSKFAKLIGIDSVSYELENGYIKSQNFSNRYNFEPIAALVDDNDSYETVFKTLFDIDKRIAKDYLKLIFFDSVVNNVDRHTENMGILRDSQSGKILSLAPNFDNNLALIATVDILNAPTKDGLIKLFVNFINKNQNAEELYKSLKFETINFEQIKNIIDEIPLKIHNSNQLCNSILERYNYLKSLI